MNGGCLWVRVETLDAESSCTHHHERVSTCSTPTLISPAVSKAPGTGLSCVSMMGSWDHRRNYQRHRRRDLAAHGLSILVNSRAGTIRQRVRLRLLHEGLANKRFGRQFSVSGRFCDALCEQRMLVQNRLDGVMKPGGRNPRTGGDIIECDKDFVNRVVREVSVIPFCISRDLWLQAGNIENPVVPQLGTMSDPVTLIHK